MLEKVNTDEEKEILKLIFEDSASFIPLNKRILQNFQAKDVLIDPTVNLILKISCNK